jgi:MFS transporter, YNFM family, putative membrane transport protein
MAAAPFAAETLRAPALPISLTQGFNLFVIGLTAFLTVVDLFATQAILPALATHYGVSSAAMGVAVNSSTLGMAAAGLLVAIFSRHLNRRLGVMFSLIALALPTTLLAFAPDLNSFAALRVCQGALMSAAFTLMLAHLGERCTVSAAGGAFAAYVTGNVASNLFGRLLSASLVETLGLHWNFYLFAALNVLGGLLVAATLSRAQPLPSLQGSGASPLAALLAHAKNRQLRISFAIGFCILFAFIGVFTYVNFVLIKPPLSVPPQYAGLVFLVFAPSIITTPLAGWAVKRLGARTAMWLGLGGAMLGLPMLLSPALPWVLAGMVLAASGTFFAQATATGFVSRSAKDDRAAASGLYLACYFLGGMVGTAVLGALFESQGWAGCVTGVAGALLVAGVLAIRMRESPA